MLDYHDTEWGVPLHDERKLFEFLILGGMQAGLSWETVLRKRQNYIRSFDKLDPIIISWYREDDVSRLLMDPGIIRNRRKIISAISNARKLLEIHEEFDSFDYYIWRFVGGEPVQHNFRSPSEIPSTTKESDVMSKDLRLRGFSFVGSTICYAFMQAVGMVNDHTMSCFRHDMVRIPSCRG